MYVVSRRYSTMRPVEEAAKRAEAGLAPILKRSPGFRGYYIIDAGDGVSQAITVFESRAAAEAVRGEVMSWIEKNLADLYKEPPLITAGEVIVTVERDMPRTEAGTGAGAEARPH